MFSCVPQRAACSLVCKDSWYRVCYCDMYLVKESMLLFSSQTAYVL